MTFSKQHKMKHISDRYQILSNKAFLAAAYQFDLDSKEDLVLLSGYLDRAEYQELITLHQLKKGFWNVSKSATSVITLFHLDSCINLRVKKEKIAWSNGYAWIEISDYQFRRINNELYKAHNGPRLVASDRWGQIDGIPVQHMILN